MFPIGRIFVLRSRSAAVCLGIIALVIACWSAGASAGSGLYTGQVPVSSQSDAERTEALKTALAQVVIRVCGDSGALAKADVAKAVADAERYVQQFSYQQDVVTEGGQPQVRLTLVAQFDRDAVDQLLRNLGLLKDSAPAEGQAAPVDATPGSYRVWVAGVRSAQDYARLIGALSGNEFVRDVQVELARGDGVQIRLTTAASLSRLLDNLSASAVIRVAKAKPPVDGLDALLDLQP